MPSIVSHTGLIWNSLRAETLLARTGEQIRFSKNGNMSLHDICFQPIGPTLSAPHPLSLENQFMFKRIPFDRVNWTTSSFLIGTLAVSLTAVPAYLWFFGLDWFQVVLFLFFFAACGFSITLGYHRLYSHLTFQAHWSVRLFVLIFGAGAFENSALMWSCEHRTHHKHVDHDEDPYDISKGLFHAHIGWLLFES